MDPDNDKPENYNGDNNQTDSFNAETGGSTDGSDHNSSHISSVDTHDAKPIQSPIQETYEKAKKSKMPKLVILAVVLLLIGAGATWYFFYNKSITNNSGNNTQLSNSFAETDPQLVKMITPTTGEVWLNKPVAMAKQDYFISLNENEDPIDYFQVGSRGDNTIILVERGGVGTSFDLFEKSKDGTVTFISQPSSLSIYNDNSSAKTEGLSSNVQFNKTTHYDSVSIPYKVSIDDKGSMVLLPIYPTLGSDFYNAPSLANVKDETIKQIGNSALIKRESTNLDTGLVSVSYFVKTPFNTMIPMRYIPLDLDSTGYQWSSGTSYSSGNLKPIARGCGGISNSVTKVIGLTDEDVRQVGRSGDGLIIYEIKDINNTLVQKAYNEFKSFMQYDTNNPNKNISSIDFVADHAVVVFKDVSGQWLIYVREDLSPALGCAKPVVYLYPTTAQLIKVRVGADVKVSDPLYNSSTGWMAFAQPSGQLTVNGVQYGSLFWEGPGYGRYPEISSGTVVKKEDAIGTIRQQLYQQGLNTTEINDFTAYWQDQIPNKPYIRLTWFNTVQMNQLAPLVVSPKPDTMIRVFLDMSGLDALINLPVQNLTSIPRDGFTVVEWGGLSTKKLY